LLGCHDIKLRHSGSCDLFKYFYNQISFENTRAADKSECTKVKIPPNVSPVLSIDRKAFRNL